VTDSDDIRGPVDYLLIEFPTSELTGGAAQAVMDLVDQGIISVYDILVVRKGADGEAQGLDMDPDAAELGGFEKLAWARSGLLTDDDLQDAAGAMEAGTMAVLILYENTWAIPFIAAATQAGGQVIASSRLAAQDVSDALDASESQLTTSGD
jgi:hypothetical protein